jgi:hypothetical protein
MSNHAKDKGKIKGLRELDSTLGVEFNQSDVPDVLFLRA